MGANRIITVRPRQGLTDDHINQYYRALLGNFLPRDVGGRPRAFSGDLGTLAIPWETLYVNRIIGGGLDVDLSGPVLPANPTAGSKFVGTGAIKGYYICFDDGVWNDLGDGIVMLFSKNIEHLPFDQPGKGGPFFLDLIDNEVGVVE